MTITYHADHDARLLEVHLQNLVTWNDLLTFQTATSHAPPCVSYDSLVVVQETIDWPPGPAEPGIRRVAERSALFRADTAGCRLAIVCESQLGYGVMRMFMAFYERAGGNRIIGMYEHLDVARAWLDSGAMEVWPAGLVGV